MFQVDGDEAMRQFCFDELAQYRYRVPEAELALLRQSSLENVINVTIGYGNKQIETQSGWGLRYVVKGGRLATFGSRYK